MNTTDNMLSRLIKVSLGGFLLLALSAPAQTNERPSPEAGFTMDYYQQLAAGNLTNIAAVATNYDGESATVSGLLISGVGSLVFSAGAGAPFEASAFPTNFVSLLIPQTNSGVVTYPIVVYDDGTGNMPVFNLATQSVGYVDATNIYHGDVQTYAPTGAVMNLSLMSKDDTVKMAWILGKVGTVTVESFSTNYSPTEQVSHLKITGVDTTNNGNRVYIAYPTNLANNFRTYCTNVEVFSCTNMTVERWIYRGGTNVNTSSNCVVFFDTNTPASKQSYVAGNRQADADSDGAPDVWEKYVFHSQTNSTNSDGDGFSDGVEFTNRTDLTNNDTVKPTITIVYPAAGSTWRSQP